MRRKLVNLTAVVSLLMCVAMTGLWALSYWIGYTCDRYISFGVLRGPP